MNRLSYGPERYGVKYSVFPYSARRAARAIWLCVRENGLESGEWGYDQVPGAHRIPEVLSLGATVRHAFGGDGWDEDAQVLLRLPEPNDAWHAQQHTEHVDRTPEGEPYSLVVGVALSDSPQAVKVAGETIAVHTGDAVWWYGDVLHQGILNSFEQPRLAAYFRRR